MKLELIIFLNNFECDPIKTSSQDSSYFTTLKYDANFNSFKWTIENELATWI